MISAGSVPSCRAGDYDPADDFPIDFTALSLEELKNVEVISVSKKPEKIFQAPAAVFVITQEDIRRSGVTTLADALRLAPGVQVARTSTRGWAISVRGFNDLYSNKLLVMIDGRSVYSSIFSGVFWDTQDTLLADIDRIEVIRGPGSTLWGANAVNGVINIITKPAKETQGALITVAGGTKDHFIGSTRYGDILGEDAHYRIYAKLFTRDEMGEAGFENTSERDEHVDVLTKDISTDAWMGIRAGCLSVQGEAYANRDDTEAEEDSDFPGETREDSRIEGGYLRGQWRHVFSESSDTLFRMYYDRDKRDTAEAKYSVNTFDFDFQHRLAAGKRHEVTWGVGYRFISDEIENFSFQSYLVFFDPERRDQYLLSAFVQDRMEIIADRLQLTIGTKVEHNDFTGYEVQPDIRFLWTPWERQSFWGSVSRSVRAPARLDHDGSIGIQFHRKVPPERPAGESEPDYSDGLVIETESGSESFDSEELIACQIGCRLQPADRFWLDLAAFYNRYKALKTSAAEHLVTSAESCEVDFIPGMPHYVNRSYLENEMKGYSYGFELAADWQVTDGWRLSSAYAYLETDMRLTGNSMDTDAKSKIEGGSPRHQFSLRSSLNMTKKLELDLWLRYVDPLPAKQIDRYTALDARIAWRPGKNLELSVTGQNLLEHRHPEFSSLEVERSVYGKVAWQF